MEGRGISVDRQILARLSGDFAQRAAALEAEAYELAGSNFNLGSPKQLGDILFGKFGLPGGTKTRTGAWSTGASVLEDLAAEGNQLCARILDWRQLSKLKSTYTDLLPEFIHPETGRVHTSYSLGATTTGRLSSSDPNLQNIPVRTEEGRRIRTAFIAEKGMKLISADYSQIELRILAHIAEESALVDAFQAGEFPVFVISLKAGGTGLNLTKATHVVHYDRWWNPAVENQATDRAFRIGQRRDVQVRKLVCVGTLEERIDAMIATKQELADLAVGTGENWVTEMSTEQLGELLRLGDEAVGE